MEAATMLKIRFMEKDEQDKYMENQELTY